MIRKLFSPVTRRFCSNTINPKICVIGSGPAGFYTAQHLIKKIPNAQIDIYDKLPVPFGLVRFGVAPDHPEVKNVINTFTKTAEHPNVRFIGNVNFGKDITLNDLKCSYNIVLLTYGAEENRRLNIDGESTANVLPARKIVGWYNGLPDDSDLKIDLTGENVAIFGQGNVAIDVARILLTPIDELRKTDITEHSLDALSRSNVKRVYLIGRRGPLQAAFTIKELREMLKLKGCTTKWRKDDFQEVLPKVSDLARPRKRLTELMIKSLTESCNSEHSKQFLPIFFRSPLSLIGENKVNSTVLGVNKLVNERTQLTEVRETLDCDLAVISIGYKSIKADTDLPFDESNGTITNTNSKIERGVYCSGWVATGPMGVILTTMNNAFLTAETILDDITRDKLTENTKPGYSEIQKTLKNKGIQTVSWSDWLKIDQYEQKEGAKIGKPREKIVDIKKMLQIAE